MFPGNDQPLRPSTTDLRFSQIKDRLDSQDAVLDKIDTKIDRWFNEHNDFRADYQKQLAISLAERAGLQVRISRVEETLYGRDGSDGLVTAVNRMFWTGIIVAGIYGTLIAPVVVTLFLGVLWVFWQIVIGKVVIP